MSDPVGRAVLYKRLKPTPHEKVAWVAPRSEGDNNS